MTGALREGVTATDLVLTVTEMLRRHGAVGKFVEFCGPGLSTLSLPDRATIGNMSPEYGATCGFFPVDAETLRYLPHDRPARPLIDLVERYAKAQGLFREDIDARPRLQLTSSTLDLATVEASLAGPRRPQDRVPLADVQGSLEEAFADQFPSGTTRRESAWSGRALPSRRAGRRNRRPCRPAPQDRRRVALNGHRAELIARLRRHRRHHELHKHLEPLCHARRRPSREEGRRARPQRSALRKDQPRPRLPRRHRLLRARRPDEPYLEALNFDLVGFGCTTCIGNSGPLARARRPGGRRERPRRRRRPQRQPQLRGPHPPAGARLLPRLAAARRRLRARRHRGHRPPDGADRPRQGRQAGLPPRHLAVVATKSSGQWRAPSTPPSSRRRTTTSSTATSAGPPSTSRRAPSASGTRPPPTSASRRSSRASRPSRRRSPTSPAPACS